MINVYIQEGVAYLYQFGSDVHDGSTALVFY